MKNQKFHLKIILAKSATILNNVFPAADIIFFFYPIIRDNLEPFSFSLKAVPFLIAFLPPLFPRKRRLCYLQNMMNHFNKKYVASGEGSF